MQRLSVIPRRITESACGEYGGLSDQQGSNVQAQVYTTFVLFRLHTLEVFVFVHQTAVVPAEQKPGAGAARGNSDGAGELERRHGMGVEIPHQRADPFCLSENTVFHGVHL